MNHKRIRILAICLLPFALLLAACAPSMGAAQVAEAGGNIQATYPATGQDVFGFASQRLQQRPGWSVAVQDADTGYMRIEQTSMRTGFLAAPTDVTEFIALAVASDADDQAVVTIEYTVGGATTAGSLKSALDAQFGQ